MVNILIIALAITHQDICETIANGLAHLFVVRCLVRFSPIFGFPGCCISGVKHEYLRIMCAGRVFHEPHCLIGF